MDRRGQKCQNIHVILCQVNFPGRFQLYPFEIPVIFRVSVCRVMQRRDMGQNLRTLFHGWPWFSYFVTCGSPILGQLHILLYYYIIYIYIHIYIYPYISIDIHWYIYIHLYPYIYIHLYPYIYPFISIYIYPYTSYIHIFPYIYIHIYPFVSIHIHNIYIYPYN